MNKYFLFLILITTIISCKSTNERQEFKYNLTINKNNDDLNKIKNYYNGYNSYVIYFVLKSNTDRIKFSSKCNYINKDYLENVEFPISIIIEKGINTKRLSNDSYTYTEIFRNFSIDSAISSDFYINNNINDSLKKLSKGIYRIVLSSQNSNEYNLTLTISSNYEFEMFNNYNDALKAMTDKI